MTLQQAAEMHGSDKGTAHKYCDFYESKIGEPKRILEFGVLGGASLKMWHTRYPDATVIGLDIVDIKAPAGTYTFNLDATKPNWITSIKPEFDLILDDASHRIVDMIASFELWWPFVAKGGFYVIEDCHTQHYTAYNPTDINFKKWVKGLGLKHEYYRRVPNDETDSVTLLIYK